MPEGHASAHTGWDTGSSTSLQVYSCYRGVQNMNAANRGVQHPVMLMIPCWQWQGGPAGTAERAALRINPQAWMTETSVRFGPWQGKPSKPSAAHK